MPRHRHSDGPGDYQRRIDARTAADAAMTSVMIDARITDDDIKAWCKGVMPMPRQGTKQSPNTNPDPYGGLFDGWYSRQFLFKKRSDAILFALKFRGAY
jgi:hypothetical protein